MTIFGQRINVLNYKYIHLGECLFIFLTMESL